MRSRRPLVGLTLLTLLVLAAAAASLLRNDRPDVAAAAAPPRAVTPPAEERVDVDLVLPGTSPEPEPVAVVEVPPPVVVSEPAPSAPPPREETVPIEPEPVAAPAATVLSGTVVDGVTGAPCAAELWLSIPGDPSTNLVLEAPGGAFEQRLETPGRYALLARCAGKIGVLRDVAVEAGRRTEGLVVTLGEAARVRVAGVVHEGDEVSVPWTCTLLADGAPVGVVVGDSEAELAVPPGPLTARLVVPGSGRRAERTVTAAAGELTTIRFD